MANADPTQSRDSAQSRQPAQDEKHITGYCEPWSLRAGEEIVLRASSHRPGPAELSLVRLHCGDPTSYGPGFSTEVIDSDLSPSVELEEQALNPGSYAVIDLAGVEAETRAELRLSVMATLPHEPQTVAWLQGSHGHLALVIDDGRLSLEIGDQRTVVRDQPLANQRWYEVRLVIDLVDGAVTTSISTRPSASPGRDLLEREVAPVSVPLPTGRRKFEALVLAGSPSGGFFDGRIGGPSFTADHMELTWDFSQLMATRSLVDTSGHNRHGTLYQLPARGVTGPTWDGSHQRWTDDPSQWDAAHFHKEDLYDAGWAESARLEVPAELPSGIYAFRLQQDDEIDHVPFFVRPAADAPTADVGLLMSSATYMAYANHRMLFDGADFFEVKTNLRPEHDYVRRHPEVGRSMYEKHTDGSGVIFSSRKRPVLHLRPGADGWNFTPDTVINAFLEHLDTGHDILSDEDVHHDGTSALDPYRVIVTSSHPEYWSTKMLDALEQWQRNGGRLIYLGGNGFYWRVAFSDEWPGAMELRRAEDGVRNWQTGDGENYHAFTGEYGGLWRRNGRAPNNLVGIGFAAQGFAKASYYEVNEASRDSRAAWVWDGVETEDGRLGTSGLGGGAAGQELDRYDPRLGSPEHAVVLASATTFGPDMLRTKEEFEGSVEFPTPDPYVRADIVFFETPAGGAVFSVGSISWFGALARNGYDNDVARMTENVVRRFADPEPFEPPTDS